MKKIVNWIEREGV